ncbi:uncharacterized protein G2W53_015271 [Senna tora]|uniref:Uncharacterized protein n=1 Tax=Senna tora TaxID=362788 RepID=A0A834WV82_9FABA|nr:uncharacterized protein G2W53_015271 [Senna tora]
MATGQISQRHRLVASDLSAPSSCCSRSRRRKRRSLLRRGRGSVWFGDVVDEKDY